MNLSEIIILLSNTISFALGFTCVSHIFTRLLTNKKISFFKLFTCLGLVYLIVSLVFIFAGIPILILTLFLFLIKEKVPLIKNILICVMTIIIILILTFITNMVFYAMHFSPEQITILRGLISYNIFFSIEWVVSSLMMSCIIYFCALNLSKHCKRIILAEQFQLDKTIYLVLINILFLVLIIAGVEFAIVSVDTNVAKYVLIFGNLITLISVVFSVLSIWLITKIISQKSREVEIVKTKEITASYKQEIQNMYNEIIDFKHDYLKIYSSMSSMLADDDINGIKNFFYKEILPFQQNVLQDAAFTHSITLIEDNIIQGIIYSYVIKARNNVINFNIDIQEKIEGAHGISSIDMSRILGILLDNAFDEAIKTVSKEVILGIIPLADQIIYVVKNAYSFAPNVSKILSEKYSTKGDKRGRGLSIVQNICNNYNNICFNIKIKNGFFLSEIIINI